MTTHVIDRRRSCPAVKLEGGFQPEVPGLCKLLGSGPTRRLAFTCPGCCVWNSLPIGDQEGAVVITSGDPAEPSTLTLATSVHCAGCCGWYGHYVDGHLNAG